MNLLKQGTLSDRVSALATIIQKNTKHSLTYLQTLIGLGKKKNRKQAELAINELKEVFCGGGKTEGILEEGKKMQTFSKNDNLRSQP